MDVSPKTLREVEFREKMRGYHPEDVDQFLERVAAGIEVLQDRLRQAIERAQRAEQAASEAGGSDDSLRRTLLLAQRTADLAIQEAREEAARIVAGAQEQCKAKLSEAEQRVKETIFDAQRRANSMVSEAEQNARRSHEDAVVAVRAELAELQATRQRIQTDIEGVNRWVGERRAALRDALQEALTRVEQIPTASPSPAADAPKSQAQAQPAPPPARVEAADPNAAWAPAVTANSSAATTAGVARPNPPSPPPLRGPLPDTVATPPDQPDTTGTDEGVEADPYFAELRRAISGRDPLGPSDADR